MQKLRIGTGGISGGRRAHAAVSQRPPISLHGIVARTRMYTDAAKGWDLSIIQGPFSVVLALYDSRTVASMYGAERDNGRVAQVWDMDGDEDGEWVDEEDGEWEETDDDVEWTGGDAPRRVDAPPAK